MLRKWRRKINMTIYKTIFKVNDMKRNQMYTNESACIVGFLTSSNTWRYITHILRTGSVLIFMCGDYYTWRWRQIQSLKHCVFYNIRKGLKTEESGLYRTFTRTLHYWNECMFKNDPLLIKSLRFLKREAVLKPHESKKDAFRKT